MKWEHLQDDTEAIRVIPRDRRTARRFPHHHSWAKQPTELFWSEIALRSSAKQSKEIYNECLNEGFARRICSIR